MNEANVAGVPGTMWRRSRPDGGVRCAHRHPTCQGCPGTSARSHKTSAPPAPAAGRRVPPRTRPLPHFGASLPLERPPLPLFTGNDAAFFAIVAPRRGSVGTFSAIDAAFFVTRAPFRGNVAARSGMHAPFWCNAGAQSGNVGAFTGTRAPFRGIVAPGSAEAGPPSGIDAAFFATDGALTGSSAGESNGAGSGGCGAAGLNWGLGTVVCRVSVAGACRDGGPGDHPMGLRG